MVGQINAFPWFKHHQQRIQTQLSIGQLHHALLLSSPTGFGLFDYARIAAKGLLCEGVGAKPCGACRQCQLVASHVHPDFHLIEPPDRQIKVDQIRELILKVSETSQIAKRKVMVLLAAESMNMAAANALLKVLEEPPKDTVFVLASERPGQLLPTIRSRCFSLPGIEDGFDLLSWALEEGVSAEHLAWSYQRPMAAKALVDSPKLVIRDRIIGVLRQFNPIYAASQFKADEVADVLHWLVFWLECLVRGENKDSQALALLREDCHLPHCYGIYDGLMEKQKLLARHANLNGQQLLESLFIEFKPVVKEVL